MADQRPLIVVAGESLIDRVIGADGIVVEHPGGGPFNTARALARLGSRVAFLGGLSTDDHGRLLRETLEADGVDVGLAQVTDAPTLVATARIDLAGNATYRFDPPDSAASGLRDVGLPAETAALHVGTLGLLLEPTAVTLAGLVAESPSDVLVMVDPNIRPDAIPDEIGYRTRIAGVLARADVVKVSVDDLGWLDPGMAPADAARRLLGRGATRGPSIVLVTDGAEPIRVVGSTGTDELPVPAVPVVDTIGAGDAFGAGFLAAWTRTGRGRAQLDERSEVREAVRFAIRVSAWTVSRPGADPPTLDDLGSLGDTMR